MRRSLAARIARLEPKPAVVPVPCVFAVRHDETTVEAFARFRRSHPSASRNVAYLVVPERDRTPEDYQRRMTAERHVKRLASLAPLVPTSEDGRNGG